MKATRYTAIDLVLLFSTALVGFAAGWRWAPAAHGDGDDQVAVEDHLEAEPVATVRTMPIRHGTIARTIVAYGSVIAQPGSSRLVSVGFESRVQQLLVVAGQHVDAKTPLLRVEPSPDSRLEVAEARRVLAAAEAELSQVQRRIESKLATVREQLTAQQNVQAAKLKLDNLHDRGAETDVQTLNAEVNGVVSNVAAQEGQIVPAGEPLIAIVPDDQIEVRLGIPPGDVQSIAAGREVQLTRVGGPTTRPVAGHVRMVTGKVSPDTRLVDVFVSPGFKGGFILDEYARGDFSVDAHDGLIVPRSALLPSDDGQTLFTVANGHAVKHDVTLIAEEGDDVQIEGGSLKAGDNVVVLGNFELEDGMAVASAGEESHGAQTGPSK